jgi:hypothetical protein
LAPTNTNNNNAHAVDRIAVRASRKVWPAISARRVRAKMHSREFARTRGGRVDSRESGRGMSQKLRRAPRLVFRRQHCGLVSCRCWHCRCSCREIAVGWRNSAVDDILVMIVYASRTATADWFRGVRSHGDCACARTGAS